MRDNDVIIRDASDGNLTATETQTFTLPGGNPHARQMAVLVLVPTDSGTDTLVVTARCTTTGHKVEVTHTTAIIGGTTETIGQIGGAVASRGW